MTVETRFAEIGARVTVRDIPATRSVRMRSEMLTFRNPRPFPILDVRNDKKGEFFTIAVPKGVEVEVIDTNAEARHLLLLARLDDKGDKARYLCGHDERHWFVAAIPETTPASTVEEAKVALQPTALRAATALLPRTKRIARHNEVYRRQGEWFFVPAPDFVPDPKDFILLNEPLTRGRGSKPHVVAEAIRSGGETRYQASVTGLDRRSAQSRERASEIRMAIGNRAALTKAEKVELEARFPEMMWTTVLVNPTMYVRGPVRHSDHATLDLKGWHRVVVNAESTARAMLHLAFID